eukprot:8637824-Pyramimonas_sp.AAC.1
MGSDPDFDFHTADLTRRMQARGIAVLPSDQWVESYDRLTPTARHAKMNNHTTAMVTTQFCDAVCYRNFSVQRFSRYPLSHARFGLHS